MATQLIPSYVPSTIPSIIIATQPFMKTTIHILAILPPSITKQKKLSPLRLTTLPRNLKLLASSGLNFGVGKVEAGRKRWLRRR